MSHTVKCEATVQTDGQYEQLTADLARAFLSNLPQDALLFPIEHDKGNQRDPWPVLVGLRATWEEGRP